MPVLTLDDYKKLLADCERIRAGYPDFESRQYREITTQIQGLKSSIHYLQKIAESKGKK